MTESMKMKWDLSQLVEFDDLGYIEEQLAASVKAAEEFSERHRGKIGTYNAKQLLDMRLYIPQTFYPFLSRDIQFLISFQFSFYQFVVILQ